METQHSGHVAPVVCRQRNGLLPGNLQSSGRLATRLSSKNQISLFSPSLSCSQTPAQIERLAVAGASCTIMRRAPWGRVCI